MTIDSGKGSSESVMRYGFAALQTGFGRAVGGEAHWRGRGEGEGVARLRRGRQTEARGASVHLIPSSGASASHSSSCSYSSDFSSCSHSSSSSSFPPAVSHSPGPNSLTARSRILDCAFVAWAFARLRSLRPRHLGRHIRAFCLPVGGRGCTELLAPR